MQKITSKILENVSKPNRLLSLLLFSMLSTACTETIRVEVPGETQIVYVYPDADTNQENQDEVDAIIETIRQNPDSQVKTDSRPSDVVADQGVSNNPEDFEVEHQGQDMAFVEEGEEDPDMEFVEEGEEDLDMAFPEEDPEEDGRLELHPCEFPTPDPILKEQQVEYNPNGNGDFVFIPADQELVPLEIHQFTKRFWQAGVARFAEFQQIGCFEYSNSGLNPMNINSISFDGMNVYDEEPTNFEFRFVSEEEISPVRRDNLDIRIAPVGGFNIPPEGSIQIHVFAQANDGMQYMTVQPTNPVWLPQKDIFVFESHNAARISPREFHRQDPILGNFSDIAIFHATLSTYPNSFFLNPGETVQTDLVCNSTGGDFQAELAYGRQANFNNRHSEIVRVQTGLNRYSIDVSALTYDQWFSIELYVFDTENAAQAPNIGDEVTCELEIQPLLDESLISESYYGVTAFTELVDYLNFVYNTIQWTGNGSASIVGRFDALYDDWRSIKKENTPGIQDEFLRLSLDGFTGSLQNIQLDLNYRSNIGASGMLQVVDRNNNQNILHEQAVDIPVGESQINFDQEIIVDQWDNLLQIRIVPLEGQSLPFQEGFVPNFNELSVTVQSLNVIDDSDESIAVFISGPQNASIPVPSNQIVAKYSYLHPELYLTNSSSEQRIIFPEQDGSYPQEVRLADYSLNGFSMAGNLCINRLILGKRAKERELYSQIFIDDIAIPDDAIFNDYIDANFPVGDDCPIPVYRQRDSIFRSGRNISVSFAGE